MNRVQCISKLQGWNNARASSRLTHHKEPAARVQVCCGHKIHICIYFSVRIRTPDVPHAERATTNSPHAQTQYNETSEGGDTAVKIFLGNP